MPFDITSGEPALPLTLPTIRKLSRMHDWYARRDRRTHQPNYQSEFISHGKKKGVLDHTLTDSNTVTVSVWRKDEDGDEADSGENVEDVCPWMLEDEDDEIEMGTQVVIEWIEGAWYVVNSACAKGLGGASEGDHYYVKPYFEKDFFAEDFFHR